MAAGPPETEDKVQSWFPLGISVVLNDLLSPQRAVL